MNMTHCVYKEKAGCDTCDCVIYKACPKFQKAHIQTLASEIVPFQFNKLEVLVNTGYSHDKNIVKSAAITKAMELNLKVKSINMTYAMDMAMGSEEHEKYVYYLDCSAKMGGSMEKVTAVIMSFIDKCEYKGYPIYIFKPSTTPINLTNYTKL